MTLTRWFTLIGLVIGLGCLQVAERNAVVLKGYAVGDRLHRLHQTETDTLLAKEQVAGLASPAALVRAAGQRQLKFVAWATLPAAPDRRQAVAAGHAAGASPDGHPLVQLAADDDTTD